MCLRHVQDTRIGTIYKRGISGGQQRRTCMAIELIAGANITIMDEPTSGQYSTRTALYLATHAHTHARAHTRTPRAISCARVTPPPGATQT